MRAIRARYDPFEQARGRIDQLKSLGHSVDKVEIMYASSPAAVRMTQLILSAAVSWEEHSCPCRKTIDTSSLRVCITP